ncbi:MarR family winged helix-turn-helix transcriptional regulator [Caulobacter sp. KR2-114]|uniref:MarR family winged helix-turn-helix transcriptional regulator n=1 Tax=Caulobacter sp. KR2-114 TaxID=3400912 RepID=UPI003C0E8D3B
MNGSVQPRVASIDEAGEFPFAPTDYVLHLLAAIVLFRDAALDTELKPLGLTISRFRTLSVLIRCGACTMTELSNYSTVDRTTLTRIADHLVADGLVRRAGAAKDRRQVLLELTEEGRARHAQAFAVIADCNQRIARGVPEESLRAVTRLLTGIIRNQTDNPATLASILDFARD